MNTANYIEPKISHETETHYREERGLLWRDTVHDNAVLFSNVQTDEKAKEAIIEHSSENVFRRFTSIIKSKYNKGQIVYYPEEESMFRIMDVQVIETDDLSTNNSELSSNKSEYESSFQCFEVQLKPLNCDEFWDFTTLRIHSENDWEQLTDQIELNLRINYDEDKECANIQLNHKLCNTLETTIQEALSVLSIQSTSYSLFSYGKCIEPTFRADQCSAIKDGMYCYVMIKNEPVYTFKRFKETYERRFHNSTTDPHCIVLIPSQNIKICGFSTYKTNDGTPYLLKYSVSVDGVEVEADSTTADTWEDTYFYRLKLNKAHNVSAGSKILFQCWILDPTGGNAKVDTHCGIRGQSYEKFENEHMGLFKIENYAESRRNPSCVRHGQFGEIAYNLAN